jgi:hypothetical protein
MRRTVGEVANGLGAVGRAVLRVLKGIADGVVVAGAAAFSGYGDQHRIRGLSREALKVCAPHDHGVGARLVPNCGRLRPDQDLTIADVKVRERIITYCREVRR